MNPQMGSVVSDVVVGDAVVVDDVTPVEICDFSPEFSNVYARIEENDLKIPESCQKSMIPTTPAAHLLPLESP